LLFTAERRLTGPWLQQRRQKCAALEVGAIETLSLPSSLTAARRGFTFYLADPSALLTTTPNAFGVRVSRRRQWNQLNRFRKQNAPLLQRGALN